MDVRTKKIIRDYEYNLTTLADVKEISAIAEQKFRQALYNYDAKALKALQSTNNTTNKEQEYSVDFEDAAFKKLFRRLIVLCHPDKIKT